MLTRHQPETGHQLARIGEARGVVRFGGQRCGIDQGHAAHRLQRRHDRGERPIGQQRFSLCRQPIAPGLGGFDRLSVILQYDMMRRLFKPQSSKPAAMQLGPCRAPFERQLWSPNPTDFSLVAERREFRPFAEAGCDWQVRPEVPFVAREKIGRTQYNRRSARIRWRGLELRLFFRQSGLAQAGEICGFV